jgi:hypothetical protein
MTLEQIIVVLHENLGSGMTLIGSRSKLPNRELSESTDYDFIVDASRFDSDSTFFTNLGFVNDVEKLHLDTYKTMQCSSTGTLVVLQQTFLTSQNKQAIKVDLVFKDNYSLFCSMWNDVPPDYFKYFLWKSGGVSRPEISKRLEELLAFKECKLGCNK